MKIIFRLFIAFLLINNPVSSSNDNFLLGARSNGMANASVTHSDVWSNSNNQAGLGFVRTNSVGVYYENRFLLKELSLKAAAATIPVKGGTFGLSLSSFGYTAYQENKLGVAFGKSFGEVLSGGIQFSYLTTSIPDGVGKIRKPCAEIGIISRPIKNATVAAHIFNITKTKLASYNDERIPTIFRLGLSYQLSKVLLAIETLKDINLKPEFKIGIEYKIIQDFFLRAGIAHSNTSVASFGFGFNKKQFKLDFASSFHPVLGFSPHIGLLYDLKLKNKD